MPKDNKLISSRKCRQCRYDRQKCLPEHRIWNGKNRCQRCEKYSYVCSANQTKAEERSSGSDVADDVQALQVPVIPELCISKCLQEIHDTRQLLGSYHILCCMFFEDEACIPNIKNASCFLRNVAGEFVTIALWEHLNERLGKAYDILDKQAEQLLRDNFFNDAAYIDKEILTSYTRSPKIPDSQEDGMQYNTRIKNTQRLVSTWVKIENYAAAEHVQEQLLKDVQWNGRIFEPNKVINVADKLTELYLMFHRRIENMNIFYNFGGSDERINVASLCLYARVGKLNNRHVNANIIANDQIAIPEIALALAAHTGSLDLVTRLLGRSYNKIDNRLESERLALHHAARRGNTVILKEIIKAGAYLEARDFDGNTALTIAARRNTASAIQELIYQGANVETGDDKGRTPLYHAVAEHYEDAVSILLDEGHANPNHASKEEDKHSRSILHEAIYAPNVRIVKMLLDAGADINSRDWYDNTPLFEATEYCGPFMVEFLLERGAGTLLQNSSQDTPLHFAIMKKAADVALLILRSQSPADQARNISMKNDAGKTPPELVDRSWISDGTWQEVYNIFEVYSSGQPMGA